MSSSRDFRGVFIFVVWTLTSFLCHQNAKTFLYNGMTYLQGQGLFLSIILTLSQIVVCVSIVDVQYKKDKAFYIIVLSHTIATFATNCSMAFMYASSTFAIKLMEPITSAVIQSLVLSTTLSRSTLISLPLIISGAVVFVGNPVSTASAWIGATMAFSSNIILAIRNVALKLKQNEPKEIKFRSAVFIFSVVVFAAFSTVVMHLMELREILPKRTTLIASTMLLSSIFHVIYSYVSTNVVLHYMTVVSHAVSNIFKRIIVVLLIYMFGQRHATPWNLAGLAVCILGLLIFLSGKLTPNEINRNDNLDISTPKRYLCKKITLIVLTISAITATGILFCETKEILNHSAKQTTRLQNISFVESFKNKIFSTESFNLMEQTQHFPNLEESNLIEHKNEILEFLKWRLLDHGQKTNILAPLLSTSIEIIHEAQRVHFNIFKDLIGKFKYAILFDLATYENKGDPAIVAGEVYLLRRLGIKLVYYCNTFKNCLHTNTQRYAGYLSKQYSKDELVILFQGGGNLVGYPFNDNIREAFIPRFSGFKIVIFSQSIFVPNNNYSGKHFNFCQRLYCCHPNLTIVLRDRQSLEIALKYWNNGTKFIMAPDMVFQIGPVRRFMSPIYDIMWLKRQDLESPRYLQVSTIHPHNVTVKVDDWWTWTSPKGSTSMETAFLIMNNGLVFLQRGRVVITDRLHGHILSTLLNIPHVLIDNENKKLSSYYNTWTRGLENVILTNDSSKAMGLALTLLEKYQDKLPAIVPFMEVNENPVNTGNNGPSNKH